MSTTNSPSTLLDKLAAKLARGGVVTQALVESAANALFDHRANLVSHLVERGRANPQSIVAPINRGDGVPLLDLDDIELDRDVVELVKATLLKAHRVLPLGLEGSVLYVAVSDATNLDALDEIQFHTGRSAQPVAVAEAQLEARVDAALEGGDEPLDSLGPPDLDDLDLDELDLGIDSRDDEIDDETDGAPVVKFVNKVLIDAIRDGATDIHFEPFEKTYQIRFRVDGMLREQATAPLNLAARLAARIKILAALDISERRVPQDGRFVMRLSKAKSIDLHVSTCPTLWGETIVIRVMGGSRMPTLDELGLSEAQRARVTAAVAERSGMVLMTGPADCGKGTLMYALIELLDTSRLKVVTAEETIRSNLDGVNQVLLNPKIGMSHANCARAFLRIDVDAMALNIIPDLETAEILLAASQSGKFVLAATNALDAPAALVRLRNMGVSSYSLAESVRLVVASRLLRRLCDHCKMPDELPRALLLREGFAESELADLRLFRPAGCDRCVDGFRGRTGIYQVLPVSAGIRDIVFAEGGAEQIAAQAATDGVPDLRAMGLQKVAQGITSLGELNSTSV